MHNRISDLKGIEQLKDMFAQITLKEDHDLFLVYWLSSPNDVALPQASKPNPDTYDKCAGKHRIERLVHGEFC